MNVKYGHSSCVEDKKSYLKFNRSNEWHNEQNDAQGIQHYIKWLTSLVAHGTHNQSALQKEKMAWKKNCSSLLASAFFAN